MAADVLEPLAPADGVVEVHGPAAGDHEHVFDSVLEEGPGDIIGDSNHGEFLTSDSSPRHDHTMVQAHLGDLVGDLPLMQRARDQNGMGHVPNLLGGQHGNTANGLAMVNRVAVDEGRDLGLTERRLGEQLHRQLPGARDQDRPRVFQGTSNLEVDRPEQSRRSRDVGLDRRPQGLILREAPRPEQDDSSPSRLRPRKSPDRASRARLMSIRRPASAGSRPHALNKFANESREK